MHPAFSPQGSNPSTPIHPVVTDNVAHWLDTQDAQVTRWVEHAQFKAKSGEVCLLPDSQGNLSAVLLGLENADDFRAFGALPSKLPKGIYHIVEKSNLNVSQLTLATMGFGLGFYEFSVYKKASPRLATLQLPKLVDEKWIADCLQAIALGRDLINTPAEDMGPDALENAVKTVAKSFDATCHVICGEKLNKENYPTIYTVGRASPREPRVIDLRWGKDKNAPKVTLVGKGVCFDSGGLDIKTASGMLLMKKDMAGAAMMLALAQLIMAQQLPIQLRLLIGAVDNAVAGNSYRPGDVIKTRSGQTVEISNTDAEGRLVLCDLLTEACSEKPNVIIDFATLTGAARVALGEDIPAFYAKPQTFADQLKKAARDTHDPLWQMPLVASYREKLKSDIADINNCSSSPFGGSITAALFLENFIDKNISWVHVDTPAWNFSAKPGRPAGGEVFGVRAIFKYICNNVIGSQVPGPS